MPTSTSDESGKNESVIGELLRPLVPYRRVIWRGTVGATLLVAIVGGMYFLFQPAQWRAAIGFRPVFEGAAALRYPNGLAFSASDIIAGSVVDEVLAKNGVQNHCPIETFRGGLSVHESSSALQFLSAEFQARLSDVRLTAVDRQRLQEEYLSRRASLGREYQLLFVRPQGCASLSRDLVLKVLPEILEQWAVESQERRGVLNGRTAVMSPAMFDLPDGASASLFVKADLTRAAITRVISNIVQVEGLSGAELVRGGPNRASLAEVRVRLEDLMQSRLDPLISMAGRGLGRESVQWISQALETATSRQRAAEMQAEALRQALREYSGINSTSPLAGRPANPSATSSDVQALTPQIDRTFIESIVSLSAANTAFRQEITRRVIEASIEAARRAEVVQHYRNLLDAMTTPVGASMPMDEVGRRLDMITAEAKESTRLFNELYAEYSRVAFRAGSQLYRVEEPISLSVTRAFSLGDYTLLVIAALLATPVILALMFLLNFHTRRIVRTALPA